MKKYIIGILLSAAMVFALCGCGGEPLAKAYDSLSKLAQEASTGGDYVEPPLIVNYDEENDTLLLRIDNTMEAAPIFDAINKEIEGKDIGTIYFSLPGTAGDGFENGIDKGIGELTCSSMQRLGIDYYVADAETHNWLKLADKVDTLYYAGPLSSFFSYSDKEKKALGTFKEFQFAYTNSTTSFGGIDLLSGAETISLVQPFELQEPETSDDPLDNVLEGNEYLNSSDAVAETEATETTAAEGEEAAVSPILFSYYSSSDSDLLSFRGMDNLKTLLIYPDTGYTMEADGEKFIKELQLIKPDLQVNPPGEAYTGDNLVAVTEIKTPNIPDDYAATILSQILEEDVEGVYKTCGKFKSKDGAPVLTGKCLIYKADPDQDSWSDKKKFSPVGDVLISDPAKKGIAVPERVGDYETFVYIYPTYSRTGVYTSGTKAYSQTLNVQVFDMTNKVVYKSESVGTAAAPQSFSYYAGSVPDKHSGEVDIDKALNYLKKLKRQ